MVKHSRMEENKRVFVEQYDTDEYEALTCECHHLARAKELNGSRRKPFFCIYCKSVYKDKNKLNLHRLEGCFAVTNDGRKTVLKIYPMFGKGQRGEIEDILIKHGLMSPRKKPSRAKRKKSAAALKSTVEEEHRPPKRGGMMLSASSSEAQQKYSSDSGMQYEVDHPTSDHSTFGAAGRSTGEMQVQMQLTRDQIEAQAWGVAKTWDAESFPRPEPVPCPGLWYLLQFRLLPSPFPDVMEDSFLHAFFEFIDKGPIDPSLCNSYGTWYMDQESDADEGERRAVGLTMSSFKLVHGRPDPIARHKEKLALQAYLQYQKACRHYEARKEAAERELQTRRERYVKEKLEAFDAGLQELAAWNWSPLLHILKTDEMAGLPPRPWLHSESEYQKITYAVIRNRIVEPPRCPLIVRLFKIVYLYCFEKSSTLSDPVTGLSRDTMVRYSSNESAAPVLRISAQSVLNEGCFLFADLPPYSEAQAEVFQDMNALLQGSPVEREGIVHKVQSFLKVVRQRAIADMAQLHPREFRVLWCGGDETHVANALKTFTLCLKSREDLDMGWVPFPAGHPDCDSVAVMQAREAVVKAIRKLHDARVLSDKNRLLAASARIPSSKFQALVETCVVQKSKGDSSGEHHSGYSTTTTGETTTTTTQQDSRSSDKDVDKEPRFSPDLNLNLLDSTTYSAAPPPKTTTVSVLGVEVSAQERPPFPLHFLHGPGSDDAQRPMRLFTSPSSGSATSHRKDDDSSTRAREGPVSE